MFSFGSLLWMYRRPTCSPTHSWHSPSSHSSVAAKPHTWCLRVKNTHIQHLAHKPLRQSADCNIVTLTNDYPIITVQKEICLQCMRYFCGESTVCVESICVESTPQAERLVQQKCKTAPIGPEQLSQRGSVLNWHFFQMANRGWHLWLLSPDMIYDLIKKKKNLDKLSSWPQLIVSGVHNVFVFCLF